MPFIRAESGRPNIISIHLRSIGSRGSVDTVRSSFEVAVFRIDHERRLVGLVLLAILLVFFYSIH